MKLKVMQSNLLPALTTAVRAINPRSSLPVLANVLLDAQDDELIITTSNLEIAYRIPVPAKIERPGKVTVPAKDLLQIVKGSSGLFEIEAQNLDAAQPDVTIKSGFVTRRIKGIDAEEFPHVDDAPDFTVNLVVSAPELRDAISKVSDFGAASDVRPILSGAHFANIGGKLTLTACNNYSMGTTQIDEYSMVTGELDVVGFVIPVANLDQVAKALAKAQPGEVVAVGFNKKQQVVFGFDSGSRIVSRLIDGIYPNWQQIVPANGSTNVEVELDAMRELFRAMNGIGEVRLAFGPDSIEAFGKDKYGVDEFSATIPASADGHETWAAKTDQIKSVLSSTPGSTLRIALNGRLSPALLTTDAEGTRYVVMPVKYPEA